MPTKPDTSKPKPDTSKPKPDTKKGNILSDKKKSTVGIINLDDEWLYHSKK
jgi:hypothetical protein